MTELDMITEVRPDVALPGPGELAAARDRLTAAINAGHTGAAAPMASGGKRSRRIPPRPMAFLAIGAIAAAAAAAAAVMVATTGPGHLARRTTSPVPPRTASYTIRHAEQALTSAGRRNLIQEIRVVGQGASFTTLTLGRDRAAATSRAVIRTYRGLILTEGVTAAGQRVFDASLRYSYAPHQATLSSETVNDSARTWWRDRIHIRIRGRPVPIWSLPRSCPRAAPPSPSGSLGSDWPAEIRLALRCGDYHVAGTGWINGVRAIKIVPRYQRPPRGVRLVSQAVWISRSTYLPVRVRWSWPRGHGLPDGSLTGDFTWLAPTRANLAALRMTIPHGYRQLASAGIGGAGLSVAPGSVTVNWPLN